VSFCVGTAQIPRVAHTHFCQVANNTPAVSLTARHDITTRHVPICSCMSHQSPPIGMSSGLKGQHNSSWVARDLDVQARQAHAYSLLGPNGHTEPQTKAIFVPKPIHSHRPHNQFQQQTSQTKPHLIHRPRSHTPQLPPDAAKCDRSHRYPYDLITPHTFWSCTPHTQMLRNAGCETTLCNCHLQAG
jgi:hypothetical protein